MQGNNEPPIVTGTTPSWTRDTGEAAIAAEQANRPGEELRMLMMGVVVGLLVGLVFLTYVILEHTHLP